MLTATLVVMLLLGGCGSHTIHYGPYKGKVVEKDTDKPIAGAVVLLNFFKMTSLDLATKGGYYDCAEALTNEQGEFDLSTPLSWHGTLFLSSWERVSAFVFHPGYGSFPHYPGTLPRMNFDSTSFPENEYVVFKLPRLTSNSERKKNLENLSFIDKDPDRVPLRKYAHLRRLRDQEVNDLRHDDEKQ